MMKNTEQDVIDAIEKALEIPSGSVDMEAIAESIEGWDSIGHLSILVALDELFEGKVAGISEVAEANTVPKIMEALRGHSLL